MPKTYYSKILWSKIHLQALSFNTMIKHIYQTQVKSHTPFTNNQLSLFDDADGLVIHGGLCKNEVFFMYFYVSLNLLLKVTFVFTICHFQ